MAIWGAWTSPVARRILSRIEWLAEHFEEITPMPLHGELTGMYKLRDGDYRIIYEPIRKERLLIIQAIGHRSTLHHRAKR